MRRIAFALLLCAVPALAQTTTTYTGTVKDLTGAAVTSGRITFTLKPGGVSNISGTGTFTSTIVSCLINASGSPVSSSDGVSPCVVVNNTALSPTGTYYNICIQPYNVTPGSCLNAFAIGGTVDITTLVPTPATQPSFGQGIPGPQGVAGPNCSVSSPPGECDLSVVAITGSLKTPDIVAGGPTIDVRYYGAKCDGVTDDTTAFTSAATAAHSLWSSSGSAVSVTYFGQCVVAGQVLYGSGVHWDGRGGTILVPTQTTSTFYAQNADDVAWDNVTIKVTTPGAAGPGTTAIKWESNTGDTANHHGVFIRNNHVINSNWGILVYYNIGTGSVSDVDISGNTVSSNTVYGNGDGIHVAGGVSNVTISHNRLINRGDGSISLTTEAPSTTTYTPTNVVIDGNVLQECRVAIDISAGHNVIVSNNWVQATTTYAGPSPAIRVISYSGGYPIGVKVIGNYFESNPSNSQAAVSIDPAIIGSTSWPDLGVIVEGNTIAGNFPLYARGIDVVIKHNTFTGATPSVVLDYFAPGGAQAPLSTQNVVLDTNYWQGAGTVVTGGNPSLYANMQYSPQVSNSGTPVAYTNIGNLTPLQTNPFSQTYMLTGISGGAGQWYKVGTVAGLAPGHSMRLNIDSGAQYSPGAQEQSHTVLEIRAGNNTAAPNISGATAFVFGTPAVTGVKIAATGGSTSITNGSWDIYIQQANAAGGTYTVTLPPSGETWTNVNSTASDPGSASASILVGNVTNFIDGDGTLNSTAGLTVDGAAPSGHVLCGNGSLYVDSASCGGAGVASINATSGAFTFTGAGVSCTSTTCTFSGTGSGVGSINGTGGVFTFTGSGVSCSGTTCTFSGTGSAVTSVGLSAPSWLAVGGSPVTSTGTLALTAATGQTAHRVIGTCGAGTSFGPCALVAADIPNLAESQITNLTTDLAAKVATTTTVNGHALSSNVVVSASDVTTGTLPAAQLPAQYKIKPCSVGMGDGVNAIPAGTYVVQFQCFNDYGVTYTVTGIQCASDNNGTSSCNAANNSAAALLTGAITATNTWASGTQSGTTTLANGTWVNWTFIADGTSKQIQARMKGTY